MSFWFGDFELDQERRQLLRSGQPVPLEPKAYELLSLLLERRPRALSRAQIRDVIWSGTYVSESTLAVVVNGIRQALGDDARHPRFIRTVHGFGYAFCGEVCESKDGRLAVGEAAPEPSPYPGLSAFTEADAEHFFGREAEVEALWEKIQRRPLLAVIGPSGVGKTSFLRAGVMPARPAGWDGLSATPGARPALGLAQALTLDLAGDAEAVSDLLRGVSEVAETGRSDKVVSAVKRWRSRHGEALLVVDQFEELFTQNAKEAQGRFASLLGRIASEAGVHVLLSLRDDFLFRCGERDGLRPVFQDLTPLYPPSAGALRRALVEPAARRGVRFEDDALVEEMVDAVEGVKGALPLLAFTVSRLWEERDRERKLLTREAYERIEGVAGALAQHAEATLSQLGTERDGMVREVFRNLVTAQGTRASAGRAELLSVFCDKKEEAGAVLDALVDARLLTEFEAPGVEGHETTPGHRRIEIVHESLLTHWPRLARWRTQDADGAQLRDQLRQAALLWEERGRRDDLLWRGASYLDYRAWRARYAGGLSALEGEFGLAMTALAERQRRRRRTAVSVVVAALTVGLGIVGVFWARSEAARRQVAAEALRAEAGKLLALGQSELERYPTAALAYATKSLELADTEEARRLALRALQDAPTALLAPAAQEDGLEAVSVAFDSKAEWLAVGGWRRAQLLHRDGRAPVIMEGEYPTRVGAVFVLGFGANDGVVGALQGGEVRVWSVPAGREVRRFKCGEEACGAWARGAGLFLVTLTGKHYEIRLASFTEGGDRLVASWDGSSVVDMDGAGGQIAYSDESGRRVLLRSLENWALPPRLVAVHSADLTDVAISHDGQQIAAADRSGEIRIWSTAGRSNRPRRVLQAKGVRFSSYSQGAKWLVAWNVAPVLLRLWELGAPAATGPLEIRGRSQLLRGVLFDPSERWLVTTNDAETALWPLGERYPRSLGRHEWYVDDVAFTPDGSSLVAASGWEDSTLRAWSLSSNDEGGDHILLRQALDGPRIAVSARGDQVAVSVPDGRVCVVPVSGGAKRWLEGFSSRVGGGVAVSFSPDGRFLAASPGLSAPAEEKVIRVWDVKSGVRAVLGPIPGAGEGAAGGVNHLSFVDGDRIVASSGTAGLLLFDRRDGRHELLSSRPSTAVAVGRKTGVVFAVLKRPDELVRFRPEGRSSETVFSCPGCTSVALDASETVVATGSEEGIVRIGPASGGEPYLFFSQIGSPQRVAFSPDGRWLASSGERPCARLWPVPDVTRTPLHKRGHDEVLATLRSWTNLRAVRDPPSPTGWKLEPGPFPGWAKLPQR
jgi:DNA-binding winged helix-turn-helix (wHTH) protein/WD40 repeat protein